MKLSYLVSLLTLSFFLLSGCTQKHFELGTETNTATQDCWAVIKAFRGDDAAREKIINQDIDLFQNQFEQFLSSIEAANSYYRKANWHLEESQPIPPYILEKTIAGLGKELTLFDTLAEIFERNTCWYDADQENLLQLGIKPLPYKIRAKGMMLELAATLALYDAYRAMFSRINENERLREYVDHGDSGYGVDADRWENLTERITDIENLAIVREYVKQYDSLGKEVRKLAEGDIRIGYLDTAIIGSRAYKLFLNTSFDELATYKRRANRAIINDNLSIIKEDITGSISETFGNIIGSVEERKGLLYGNEQVAVNLKSILKPGDILLEKTPFRLTDKLIPGYWGHAAMWVGTEAELCRLGLWNHEIIKPYQEQIREKHLVAEALREGTVLNPLEHFLNIDDLMVLRLEGQSREELEEVLLRVFRQLGKEYDFNFDVETTDKIVCSHLVYIAFPKISWPTDNVAGRYTVSPDNIAVKAVDSKDFEIIRLFVDGVAVSDDKRSTVARLLKEAQE